MKKILVGLVLAFISLMLFIVSMEQKDSVANDPALNQVATPSEQSSSRSEPEATADISDQEKIIICRATAAAIGYHPIFIVDGSMKSAGVVEATYNRPSDNIRWTTQCKFAGNRVIWANVDRGIRMRWREHPSDERIEWTLSAESVLIEEIWPDGSRRSESYAR